MSKLHEPITELTRGLQIPADRDLPASVREAQQRMLLAEITSDLGAPVSAPASRSFAQRALALARAFGVRIGLLALLAGVCLASSLAMNGGARTRAVEITAVTGGLSTVMVAAARAEGTSKFRALSPQFWSQRRSLAPHAHL